jgi:hypothetical protein
MEIGMGQYGEFDCTGLVIHAISRALDVPITDWPRNLRHTRQMWRAVGESSAELDSEEAGVLLVSQRLWRHGPDSAWVPAHISILTGMTDRGVPITIQAQAAYEGAVVERPIRVERVADIIGTISVPRLLEVAYDFGRLESVV